MFRRRYSPYAGLEETDYSRREYVRHMHNSNIEGEPGSNESTYYRGLIPSDAWDYFEDIMSNEWDAVERCGTPYVSWQKSKIYFIRAKN